MQRGDGGLSARVRCTWEVALPPWTTRGGYGGKLARIVVDDALVNCPREVGESISVKLDGSLLSNSSVRWGGMKKDWLAVLLGVRGP